MAGSVFQMLGSLALVLVLIAGTAWLLRRIQGGRMMAAGPLQLRGQLVLGPRERVVLIEIEDVWIVAGVTGSEITPLHVLPRGELPEGGETGALPLSSSQFAKVLAGIRGKTQSGPGGQA